MWESSLTSWKGETPVKTVPKHTMKGGTFLEGILPESEVGISIRCRGC